MNTQYPESMPTNGVRERAAIEDRTLSHGEPSEPVLGLPLARIVPMDVHAMLDYGNALAVASGALDDCLAAQIASIALGAADLGVSAMTDYRLSVAKVIPIETHEMIDYAWSIAAIAAPFVFGYWKRSPRVALTHVIAGASNILVSLFTDYRSYKRRSQAAAR